MATRTVARVSPPASAHTRVKLGTPKPILKKPAPLPLSPSPFPFSASFSIYLSSSTQSPHVHFPPSPRLHSTYIAHSPNTYDRAPISVSPNPLALPSWGDRVYSPTLDGFKPADRSKHIPFATLRYQSPTSSAFLDPRSPPPKPRIGNMGSSDVCFAALPNKSGRNPTELGKALTTYPRSPYPSAPLSPIDFEPCPEEISLREKVASRRTLSLSENTSKRSSTRLVQLKPLADLIPSPLSKSSYLSPAEECIPSPLTKPFSSSSSKKPPPLPLTEPAVRNSADQRKNDSSNIIPNVIPLDAATSLTEYDDDDSNSAGLSQAFWQSMSFKGTGLQGFKVDDSREMTSYHYPVSVVRRRGETLTKSSSSSSPVKSHSPDVDTLTTEAVRGSDAESQQFQLMFATSAGVLWAPAAPRISLLERQSPTSLESGSALSPRKKMDFSGLSPFGIGRDTKGLGSGTKISRSTIGSPSPSDPSAKFPSFTAVLANAEAVETVPESLTLPYLQYPPRVQVAEKRGTLGNSHFE